MKSPSSSCFVDQRANVLKPLYFASPVLAYGLEVIVFHHSVQSSSIGLSVNCFLFHEAI